MGSFISGIDKLLASLMLMLILFLGAVAFFPDRISDTHNSAGQINEKPVQGPRDQRRVYGVYLDRIDGEVIYVGKGNQERFNNLLRNTEHSKLRNEAGDRFERVWAIPPRLDELTALQAEASLIERYNPVANLKRGNTVYRELSTVQRLSLRLKVLWVKAIDLVPSTSTIEQVSKWVFRVVDVIELVILSIAGFFGARAYLRRN